MSQYRTLVTSNIQYLPPSLARPGPVLVLDLDDDELAAEQTRVLHGVVQPGELLEGVARVFVPEPGVTAVTACMTAY